MPINQLGRRFGAGLDTSAAAQGSVPKGSAIMSGLQQGVETALAIKKSRNDDKIMQMEQNKIDKALSKQAARQNILGDTKTNSEQKQRKLMAINEVEVASQLGKVEEQIASRELVRKQKEADLALTTAKADETTAGGKRQDKVVESNIAVNEANLNLKNGQAINDKVNAMRQVDPILVPMFLKNNEEARKYYSVSQKGVDQMALAVQNTKLSKVLAKQKTINTSPTEDHLIMADNVVASAGLSPSSMFGLVGNFADKESEDSFKDALAGMGLLIAGKDNTVTLRQAMERALPLVARAMDNEGRFHNNALAPYVSTQTALVQPTMGLDGTQTNPPPQKAMEMGAQIIKEKGELSPEQKENFKVRYNLDPDALFRSDEESMLIVRDAAAASKVNEDVLAGKGDGSVKGTKSFMDKVKEFGASVVTEGSAPQKRANKEFLRKQREESKDKAKLKANKKKIAELTKLDRDLGAGKRAKLDSTTRRRDRIKRLKKENEAISDGLGIGSTSPKADSSAALTTQKQTDAQIADTIFNNPPKGDRKPQDKNEDNFIIDLSGRESSFGKNNLSPSGKHAGIVQMGKAAREEGGLQNKDGTWTKLAKSQGINSVKDFIANPEAQVTAVKRYHNAIKGRLKATKGKLDRALTATVGGEKLTMSGLIAASHLVGEGKIRGIVRRASKIKDPQEYDKYLTTKFREALDGNKGDPNRTPALEYILKFNGYYNE